MAVMSYLRTACVCASLAILGPLSMSLYTPAIPTLVHEFGTSPAQVKLSITLYLAGLALAQLVGGAMSDAMGRRPVAIGFFSLYIVGTLLCLCASSIEILNFGRLMQGAGASAGLFLSRAIVRDQFKGQLAARLLNATSLILIGAPAIAPAFGGVLVQAFGWRSTFIVMLLLCVAIVGLVIGVMTETLQKAPRKVQWSHSAAIYRELICQRNFLLPAVSIGAVTGGVYTLSTVLPFVMTDRFGLSPATYGLCMISQAGAFGIGSLLTSRLLRCVAAERISRVGGVLVVLAAVAFLSQWQWLPATPQSIFASLALWAFGNALLNPGMISLALADSASSAGAASALLGSMQIGLGFAGSALGALLFRDNLAAAVLLMPIAAAIGVGAQIWVLSSRSILPPDFV